jgi:hypothetical protein
MEAKSTDSNKTRNNWILDAGLFLGAIIASISGIYFLIFPDGGYMGGRNPYYGIKIIFDRTGWEWIHTWLSLGMVAVALIHIGLHWKWILSTTKRVVKDVFTRKKSNMNAKGRQNVLVDGLVAVSFLICAISGIYFIVAGESRGGLAPDPMFLFSRTVWDVIHTWSSVVLISGGIVHFAIHWGWVTKVTRTVFRRVWGESNNKVVEQVVFEN